MKYKILPKIQKMYNTKSKLGKHLKELEFITEIIKKYKLKTTLIFKNFVKACELLKDNFFIICNYRIDNYLKNIINYNCNKIANYKIRLKNLIKLKPTKALYINIDYEYKNYIYNNNLCKCSYIKKQKVLKKAKSNNFNIFSTNIDINNRKRNVIVFMNSFIKLAKKVIIGQNKNITQIADKLINLNNKNINKPIANYFLCGPSGTGKTEISKILSTYIYRNKKSLIRKDMGTFNDPSSVSKLLGTAPGFKGHEEKTNLVDEILKKPNSVVLFDEIEKSNEKVHSVFLQILDEGVLTNSQGVKGYFNKSIVVFTSNLGSEILKNYNDDFFMPESYTQHLTKEIYKKFSPEFINRLDSTIIFYPLNALNLCLIFDKFIENNYSNVLLDEIMKHLVVIFSVSPTQGARFLFKNINLCLLPLNLDDKTFLNYNKVCNFLIK